MVKVVLSILLALIIVVALAIGGQFFGLWELNFFGVKYQNAHRKIFEQSQAYVESERQQLASLRLQYMEAKGPEDRLAIRSTIVHMYANVDPSTFADMPVLARFLEKMNTAPDPIIAADSMSSRSY